MLIRSASRLDLFHDFYKLESILKNNQFYILIGSQHFNGSSISIGKKQHKTFCKSGVETASLFFIARERLDLWKHSLPTLQRWLCHNTCRNNMITYHLKSNTTPTPQLWQIANISIKICLDFKHSKCLFHCWVSPCIPAPRQPNNTA